MTKIIRQSFTPATFNDALSMRELMNQLVENAFVSPSQWLSGKTNGTAPALDVTENSDAYTIKAALPGWKPENVDVTFENGIVTLKGNIEEEAKSGEDEKVHYREIRKASFSRSVSLPTDIETDKANAEFENGILTLTLPKAEIVKPKQIKIAIK